MTDLTLGVLATTRKENEHRLPIHPRHLDRIDPRLRERIFFEHGYGDRFGVPADEIAAQVAGMRTREEVLARADVVLLPKPLAADLCDLREGQVLWGWPHCVQDDELIQVAIDRRLTLIAWEAMNHWTSDGSFGVHVFHKNNELAGYCSVLHALTLQGVTGHYGRPLSAVVISFGATGRGAATMLTAQSIHDVTVLTQRDPTAVAASMPGITYLHMSDTDEPGRTVVQTDDGPVPTTDFLARHDIVVNCILQDTDAPLMFVTDDEVGRFAPGSVIIDVSCDEGMGFEWARPTSFSEPMFTVGSAVAYYAVDHTPSYLWDAATWEISEALLPYLPSVLAGPDAWHDDETLRKAIEIRDGVVQNPKILSFQGRSPDYPHARG